MKPPKPAVYGVPADWDVGCDDCGEIDRVETEEASKGWCDSHECKPDA